MAEIPMITWPIAVLARPLPWISGSLDRKARSGGDGSQLGVVRQKCVESNGVADVKSGGQMDGVQSPDHGGKGFAGAREDTFGDGDDMEHAMNQVDVAAKLDDLRVVDGGQEPSSVQGAQRFLSLIHI